MAIIGYNSAGRLTGWGGCKLRFWSNRGIIVATAAFFVLSIGDALLTLWGLKLDVIEEVNPLMRELIERKPWLFISLKTLIPVALGTYCWLRRDSDRKLVTYALVLSLGVYVVVSIFHIYWIVLYNIS